MLCLFGAIKFNRMIGSARVNGGNSVALHTCSLLADEFAVKWAEDPSNHVTFNSVRRSVGDAALGRHMDQAQALNARFLVWDPMKTPADGRSIVVVCDRPYDDPPQPTIWTLYSTTASHAVGYADGSIGLISTDEYGRLDLKNFVDIRTWLPPSAFGAQGPPN